MRDATVVEPAFEAQEEPPPNSRLKLLVRGDEVPCSPLETRATLMELARRKCDVLDPAMLVEQVLIVTEGTDWPCRRAALDAMLRRIESAERDSLRIVARPPKRRVLGTYGLAGKTGDEGSGRRKARPYKTELLGVSPFRASCDCADFTRGSLGLCKHIVAVLADLSQRETKLARACAEQAQAQTTTRASVEWNPIRPWTGEGDRLAGLRTTGRLSRVAPSIARLFPSGAPSAELLRNIERRRAMLTSLSRVIEEGRLAADSATRALIRDELDRANRQVEVGAFARFAAARLKTLKRQLYPYQQEGVSRFFSQGRLLLADDMGLGKTVQAIAACHGLFHTGQVTRGLLLVPASLKSQWVREWNATTDVPIQSVEGGPDERQKALRSTRKGFLVMNYEQLLRDLGDVQRFAPHMVVLDEAQRIKNWATKSHAYVRTLEPQFRIVLTGTPMENRLEELATILDWVDDVALTPKWRLGPWHSQMGDDAAKNRTGARNLATLRERMKPWVLRRIRRDVLSQLPPRTDTRVPVEMTGQQREEHDALSPAIAAIIQRGKRRPLAQKEFLRLMQLLTQQRIISNGLAQFNFDELWPLYSKSCADDVVLQGTCSPKLVEVRRLVTELAVEQGRKTVVFSQWRSMLRLAEWAVRDVLDSNGLRSVYFTGAESQKLRTKNVVDFHDEPDVRVMFLSDAGGVGLNLQRAASACINLELPWNPAVLEQRIGRIYRLGQSLPIDVYNLTSDYGIESRIADLIGNKRALFMGVFDGTSDEVRYEEGGGFLAEVERLIEAPTVQVRKSEPGADVATTAEDDADAMDDASGSVPSAIRVIGDAERRSELAASVNNTAALPIPKQQGQEAEDAHGSDTIDTLATKQDAAQASCADDGPAETDQSVSEAGRPFASESAAGSSSESAAAGSSSESAAGSSSESAAGSSSESAAAGSSSESADVSANMAEPSSVGSLLQQVRMSRSTDGGIRLEAPPQAAKELAQLFAGLAGLLARAAGP